MVEKSALHGWVDNFGQLYDNIAAEVAMPDPDPEIISRLVDTMHDELEDLFDAVNEDVPPSKRFNNDTDDDGA